MTKLNRLAQTAANHISATRVSPRRWEYRADETRETVRLTTREMASLGALLEDGVSDAYSVWCQDMPGVVVG